MTRSTIPHNNHLLMLRASEVAVRRTAEEEIFGVCYEFKKTRRVYSLINKGNKKNREYPVVLKDTFHDPV